MNKLTKTNAMRLLDGARIAYRTQEYELDGEEFSGENVARIVGRPAEEVFKTLVTRGDKNGINVFVIPVNCELDLKKAAVASGNKSVEMVAVKEILALTGYIRGGCSPVGMKKKYPTFVDETAVLFEEIGVSAGIIGGEILINAEVLCEYLGGRFAEITK